jgi:hypothetical protein
VKKNSDDTVKLSYNKLGYNKLGYNKLGYNKLGYNKLGYNKLGYNKLGYNKLGYNKLSIIMKKKIFGFVHYNREKLLVKLREQTNHFFCS